MNITSPYGPRIHPISKRESFHSGIDLRANYTEAYAIADGTIRIAKSSKYPIGRYIVIDHSGFVTIYGHMDSWAVPAGTRVKKGDVIGITGNSGGSTAPHLHFEIRLGNPQTLWSKNVNGSYNQSIDPIPFLKSIEDVDYKTLYENAQAKLDKIKEIL
jgi:murein DD-endopeptidase MepM/ murein hydrolase activator NlpD